MTLADLAPGELGVVEKIIARGLVLRRLLDMGLVPGTEVQARFKSPGRGPAAYAFRGTVLALRLDTASQVLIRPIRG